MIGVPGGHEVAEHQGHKMMRVGVLWSSRLHDAVDPMTRCRCRREGDLMRESRLHADAELRFDRLAESFSH